MRGESLPWLHAVFVDDPQTAKVHMRRIVVSIERERVIGIQPAKVKVAALFRFANRDHIWSRMERRHPVGGTQLSCLLSIRSSTLHSQSPTRAKSLPISQAPLHPLHRSEPIRGCRDPTLRSTAGLFSTVPQSPNSTPSRR